MELKSTKLTKVVFMEKGFWTGTVLFQIGEGERFHNISAEVRLDGNKNQRFSEIEELLLQKEKSVLLLAST